LLFFGFIATSVELIQATISDASLASLNLVTSHSWHYHGLQKDAVYPHIKFGKDISHTREVTATL